MKLVIRAIIELAGFPKSHIEESIKKIREQIEKDKDLKVIKKEITEVKEINKMWATFLEVELEVPNLNKLLEFNLNFLPSSVEILEPNKITLDTNEFTDFVNLMQTRLHEYTTAINKLILENRSLKAKKK